MIAFYSLAIILVAPKVSEALGIGIVAGIICALISHSLFPPANLISEPVGALVAVLSLKLINQFTGVKGAVKVKADGANSIGRAGSLGHIIELRGYHSGSKITFTKLPLHAVDLISLAIMLAGLIAYAAYVFKLI